MPVASSASLTSAIFRYCASSSVPSAFLKVRLSALGVCSRSMSASASGGTWRKLRTERVRSALREFSRTCDGYAGA
jgi:hypothetical protein